ncbi:hypothetical protein BV25DRAFT_1440666 [Artomyces pyxidatus]|uniref:Uncharacterized protein n=1 Tax=Artomyces pyxidatus TaxID=48021 RepID=A0ACB8SLY3_9AGAM|nr:hypothetical protein BV25DRAFT_1440666 [Artomyces pyxidatus]
MILGGRLTRFARLYVSPSSLPESFLVHLDAEEPRLPSNHLRRMHRQVCFLQGVGSTRRPKPDLLYSAHTAQFHDGILSSQPTWRQPIGPPNQGRIFCQCTLYWTTDTDNRTSTTALSSVSIGSSLTPAAPPRHLASPCPNDPSNTPTLVLRKHVKHGATFHFSPAGSPAGSP